MRCAAGFNCAEAVNFGPPDWLPWGSYVAEKYRREGRSATLSHEALLVALVTAAPQVAARLQREAEVCGRLLPLLLLRMLLLLLLIHHDPLASCCPSKRRQPDTLAAAVLMHAQRRLLLPSACCQLAVEELYIMCCKIGAQGSHFYWSVQEAEAAAVRERVRVALLAEEEGAVKLQLSLPEPAPAAAGPKDASAPAAEAAPAPAIPELPDGADDVKMEEAGPAAEQEPEQAAKAEEAAAPMEADAAAAAEQKAAPEQVPGVSVRTQAPVCTLPTPLPCLVQYPSPVCCGMPIDIPPHP
jgi:hypothetical protein